MRYLPICLLATTSLFAGTASAQSPTTVLFVGNAGVTAGADAAILTYLNTRYGKANVTYLDTEPNGITSSEVLGYDVVVLSSTPSSSRYRGILHNSPAPIVNMEEAVAGNRGGEFSVTTGRLGDTAANHKIVIKRQISYLVWGASTGDISKLYTRFVKLDSRGNTRSLYFFFLQIWFELFPSK